MQFEVLVHFCKNHFIKVMSFSSSVFRVQLHQIANFKTNPNFGNCLSLASTDFKNNPKTENHFTNVLYFFLNLTQPYEFLLKHALIHFAKYRS